jgi:hypothetical protein
VGITKGWVFTGGTNGGVMELVGQAMARQMSEQGNVCLGIATWGIVQVRRCSRLRWRPPHPTRLTIAAPPSLTIPGPDHNPTQGHEELEEHKRLVHHYVPYQSKADKLLGKALRETTSYHRPARGSNVLKNHAPVGQRARLEPNHSHFLFVDAGPAAEGQFGKEIELRAALEDAACARKSDGPQTVHATLPSTHLRPVRLTDGSPAAIAWCHARDAHTLRHR